MTSGHYLPSISEESQSNSGRLDDRSDLSLVMAEKNTRDVVDQAQSAGDLSPSDVPATNQLNYASGEDEGVVSNKTRSSGGQINDTSESFPDTQTNGGAASYRSEQPDTANFNTKEALTYKNPHVRNPERYIINGEDGFGRQPSGDVSGGSDTDTSRADASSVADGARQDDRRDSVKKPFKPVSFAKFSVNKSSGSTPTIKPLSEKTPLSSASSTPSLQSSTKPRLVAKATSGLRDAAPKSLRSGGKNGPDPLQVWNKNRPTAAPSTKHLTDEELKQQYGIHMTSRIQADGEGKEAKWADIDDDEDDWAPETIEWNDGTKITLAPSDNIATPTKNLKAMLEAPERSKDLKPVKQKMAPVASTVGPNATVLKLGAHAERQQQQAKLAASQQKASSEKPSQLTAKAPAPVPTKSPWASLPPVEKASPIDINPQALNAPPRYTPRDVQSGPPPPGGTASPAQEISADDFNRSWRQDQEAHPRELFMPNSGRYEAVQDGRRRLSRNDQNFRAPAVLQRPSQTGLDAPAEPSPAFQTHRVSTDQDRASWSRRRTSSNVSGGSGSLARRMSMGRHAESPVLSALVSYGYDAAERDAAPVRGVKASGPLAHSPSEVTPNSSTVDQPLADEASLNPPVPQADTSAAATEAEVEAQKRMMKAKVAEARKRREDEDAKEEAARRERIKLKMQSLGLPPLDEDGKSKAVPPPQRSPASADIALQATSPPKPPVLEASGEPKQYGMMKLHHPDTVKKLVSGSEKATEKAALASTKRSLEPAQRQAQQAQAEQISSDQPRPPGDLSADNQLTGGQYDASPRKGHVENAELPTSKTNASESTSAWNASQFDQRYSSPGNLWGHPSNNKALGNGTFDQSLAAFAPRDISRTNVAAMDQSTLSSKWTGRNNALGKSPQLPSVQSATPDSGPPNPPKPSPDQRPLAANSEADSAQPMSRPVPIGPPQAQRWQPSPVMRSPNPNLAAWHSFHNVAAAEDRADNERYRKEQAVRAEEEARGVRQIPQMNFNETFRQVEVGDAAGQRQVVGVTKSFTAPNQQQPSQFGTVTSFPSMPLQGMPSHGRHSRFFQQQQMNSDMTQALQSNLYGPHQVPSTPSPPPAEEIGGFHPLYNNVERPRVSLPTPKAVVKLPPAAPLSPPPPPPKPQPMTFASVVSSTPPRQATPSKPATQANVNPPDWQNKFNELLGKKSVAEKKSSLPVLALSKDPLDHSAAITFASVSLPQREEEESKADEETWLGKYDDEAAMFEDRVAGSLPTVKVVSRQFPHNWHAARIPRGGPKSKPIRAIESLGSDAFTVYDLENSSRLKEMTILVHIPGSNETKSKVIPHKGAHQPTNKGPRNVSGAHKNYRKGGPKSRESSGSYASPMGPTTKTGAVASNGHIPTSRPQTNKWGRTRQASGIAA